MPRTGKGWSGALLALCIAGCTHTQSGGNVENGTAAPPVAAAVDVRKQIEDAIRTEVEPLRGRDEVMAYLDRLRARAVAQRKVTALEVEPGLAAIERLEPALG